MTISEQIICIANSLANEGKQPTVALVKARLTEKAPLPLPLLISTLKNWQHQPERVMSADKDKAEQTNTTEENTEFSREQLLIMEQLISDRLNQAITPLIDKIKQLEQHIKKLTKASL